MNFKIFLLYLFISILLASAALIFLNEFEAYQPYKWVGIISILFFVFLSAALYFILRKFVYHPDRQLFISGTIGNMFLKMVLSITLLLVYYYVSAPQDGLFVVPFLIVYVIFTIFETIFMVRLADENPKGMTNSSKE